MKKTVTIQEAIKANEHSRVRRLPNGLFYDVGYFNSDVVFLSIEMTLADWEIESKPLEIYVNVFERTSSGQDFEGYASKELADKYAGNYRIRCVKMREVTDE